MKGIFFNFAGGRRIMFVKFLCRVLVIKDIINWLSDM